MDFLAWAQRPIPRLQGEGLTWGLVWDCWRLELDGGHAGQYRRCCFVGEQLKPRADNRVRHSRLTVRETRAILHAGIGEDSVDEWKRGLHGVEG